MGIRHLKNNLISIKNYTEYNYGGSNNESSKFIEKCICHIDFSILLYKILSISESMQDSYNKIKFIITNLKKNNLLIIYIDPETNEKKEVLQKERKKEKNKLANKILDDIRKQIEEVKKYNLDIDEFYYNFLKNKNEPDNFEDYKKTLNMINNKEIIKDNNKPNIENLNDENCISIFFDLENIKIIDKNEIDENEIDENEIDKEYILDESINIIDNIPLIEKKKIFDYFIIKSKYLYHRKYILEKLLENNIIDNEEIIYTKNMDAEIKIIKVIKDYFLDYKNIIFSLDQDVILFSLLHIKKKYIYIKENYDMFYSTVKCIENNTLSKNISILTFIFNKSDYFPGIKQFEINKIKLCKLFKNYPKSKSILSKKIQDIKILCATFLQFFTEIQEKSYNNIITKEYINKYFDDINLYFNMDNNFYLSKNTNLNIINIKHLIYYLQKENIKKLIIDSNIFCYVPFNQ